MNSEEQNQSEGGLVEQAKHAVSAVGEQAKDQVNQQLDVRKEQAIDKMSGVAEALRWTSDKLKDVGPLGEVTGRAAEGIKRVSSFIEDKKIEDVIRGVEQFARREPALFLGAALALGMVGGRFLKSSSHGTSTGRGGPLGDREMRSRSYGAAGETYGSRPYGGSNETYGTRSYGAAGETYGSRPYGGSSDADRRGTSEASSRPQTPNREGLYAREGRYGSPQRGTSSGESPTSVRDTAIDPAPIINVGQGAGTPSSARPGNIGSGRS